MERLRWQNRQKIAARVYLMLGAGIVARGDPGGPKAAGTQSADLGSNDDGRHACRGLSRILATLWNRPDLKAG